MLVLESMKMETVLNAPFAGRVKELLVSAGSQVETGSPLVRLEPVGDAEEEAAGETETVDLELPNGSTPATDPVLRAEILRRDLYAVLRGYDLDLVASICQEVEVPVVASGGAGNYEHLRDAVVEAGASAVAAGAMFQFTHQTPAEARDFLAAHGVPVRRGDLSAQPIHH